MKVAFLFSGQGSQYVGMGKELYQEYEVFKDTFNRANEVLDFDVKETCFTDSENKLNITEYTQSAILTMSIGIFNILKEYKIKPDVVAGLSLGEYSAHIAAGSFNFDDGLILVRKRGKYMSEAVPQGKGTMAAVIGLSREDIKEVLNEARGFGIVEAANYNCKGQIVIGGEILAVRKAMEIAKENGAKKVIELKVSGPFHTSMLKAASEKLSEALKDIRIEKNRIPLVTNVTGDYLKEHDDIKRILTKQVISSVYFEDSIENMIKDGVDTFIEIGPGRTLSTFVKTTSRAVKIFNIEDKKSLEKLIEFLKK